MDTWRSLNTGTHAGPLFIILENGIKTLCCKLQGQIPLSGGPLMPLIPPRDPRGPLGRPRCREGGPRRPADSNWGFVACSTFIGFPSRDWGKNVPSYQFEKQKSGTKDLRPKLRDATHLPIHFPNSILCISWILKSHKSKAS